LHGWTAFKEPVGSPVRRFAASIVARDFFTVDSVLLRRYYVLLFIAHESRRVWLAGCSPTPTGAWVTQQARNLGLDFADQGVRLLIRDRDSEPTGSFDVVFRSAGIRVVKTPVRAPQANAIAERFVRTIRAEWLDWLLILNRRHLERVLRIFVDHNNTHRPHRALKLQPHSPRSHRRHEPSAQSTDTTATRASSTNSTETPPEARHEYWHPSGVRREVVGGRLAPLPEGADGSRFVALDHAITPRASGVGPPARFARERRRRERRGQPVVRLRQRRIQGTA
jgi:hypothetical protein